MELGISSYAFTWAIGVPGNRPAVPMNYNQLVEKVVDLKLFRLQIADNMPLHQLDSEERSQLLKKAQKNRINMEVGMRGLTSANFEMYIDIAEYFRSPILRTVIDVDDFKPDIPTIISIIRDYLPEFTKRNISLAIENHDRFKAADFARIIETVGDIHVGICMDSVNSMGAGEGMDEVLRLLGPYTINLHIKDFIVRRASHMMGFVVEGMPAGEGILPVKDIIDKLIKLGQCESGILELWTPPQNNIEATIRLEDQWVKKSIENLRTLLQ